MLRCTRLIGDVIVPPVLRLILAGVFALAGVTKLLDRRGSQQSLQDFGVPNGLIPALVIALPLAELLAAVALLPQATAIYGALAPPRCSPVSPVR